MPTRMTALALMLVSLAAIHDAKAQQRPYAAKATVPADVGNDPFLRLEINSLAAAEVPALGEVEVPPYPGALIIRTEPARQLTEPNGAPYESLPIVVLVSSDPPGTVIDYYVRRLNSWNHNEIDGSHYFWLGADEFAPLAASGQTSPSVQILPAGSISLVPAAETEIRVRYRPGGGLVVPG